ncbi:hypothetical protein [Eggerthella sinensis]|uniref:hypothetical protein n=1 Tax=Eggerthella sinensis TaxID=242230 RepID=UPI0022E73139|nr:hypothetical protein [Eggerthella sinensis]
MNGPVISRRSLIAGGVAAAALLGLGRRGALRVGYRAVSSCGLPAVRTKTAC